VLTRLARAIFELKHAIRPQPYLNIVTIRTPDPLQYDGIVLGKSGKQGRNTVFCRIALHQPARGAHHNCACHVQLQSFAALGHQSAPSHFRTDHEQRRAARPPPPGPGRKSPLTAVPQAPTRRPRSAPPNPRRRPGAERRSSQESDSEQGLLSRPGNQHEGGRARSNFLRLADAAPGHRTAPAPRPVPQGETPLEPQP
jgi:hypothetical protein